jgi:photosystem II stability/assembly factor-like uncharacterized protein
MTSNPFGSLEWRSIGPHRGGRVVAVAGHPTERATFYFGGCAGGVWKTTNAGAVWENITDGQLKTSAVGALAVSDSNPNIIYAGMGEATIRSNVSHGDGVYKSSDGGRTWTNVGLKDSRHIGDIIIHPTNPNVVYVGALGHAWGTNEERGVFRTTDGGATWQKVLYTSNRAGCTDLAMDPNNPHELYANMWVAQRYPHTMLSGGEGCGIWKSSDGGDTWTEITRNKGLPTGALGKIGLAASPAKAGRVWALIEAEEKGGVYRSDDAGATWQHLQENADLRRRPWYYMHIFADPSDADTAYICNLAFWKSTNGGKDWEVIPTPHGDNHALWVDPKDSSRMVQGNDGGACVSFDGGRTWSSILNQPTAQFYHVTTDNQVPYHVYGSQQDNWAMRLPSIGFEGAISWKDYVEPGGGESGYIAISPKPPHKVYGGGIGTGLGHGRLLAWNPETRQARNVTVWPEMYGFGAGAIAMKYRFQWTFPVEFSPHDPDAIYACSNHIHRSTDEGTSWETISPDLTRNDPDKIQSSGGEITDDNSGAEIYCTIFAFRESPHEAGVFWTGSDCGVVNISRDGGKNWTNITPADLPEWSRITIIEPSPFDKETCYLCATRYQSDDNRPYLYKTTDYGATWKAINGNLPGDEFTRVIRCDPEREGLLYVGTETGIFVSLDDGLTWERLESNLPVVPIWDLVVKGTDLVAATHGRSFWILDDVTPLRQLAEARNGSAPRLFQPRDTTRFRLYGRAFGAKSQTNANYKMTGPVTVAYHSRPTPQGTMTEDFLDAGKNPPDGVIVHYFLPEKPEGEVTLRFLDAGGKELRSFTSEGKDIKVPVAAGMNRFVWNMREAKPTELKDDKGGDIFAAMLAEIVAPKALPGSYQVELKVGETTLTQPFSIVHDPRLPATEAELKQQYDLKATIRDKTSEIHEALNKLRSIRKQIEQWEERAEESGGGSEEFQAAAKGLKEQLLALEGKFVNLDATKPKPGEAQLKEKLGALSGMIDESDDIPTRGSEEVFAILKEQADEQLTQLHHLAAEDLVSFSNVIRNSGIPIIVA